MLNFTPKFYKPPKLDNGKSPYDTPTSDVKPVSYSQSRDGDINQFLAGRMTCPHPPYQSGGSPG